MRGESQEILFCPARMLPADQGNQLLEAVIQPENIRLALILHGDTHLDKMHEAFQLRPPACRNMAEDSLLFLGDPLLIGRVARRCSPSFFLYMAAAQARQREIAPFYPIKFPKQLPRLIRGVCPAGCLHKPDEE